MSKKWTETETFKRLQREDPLFTYDEEDYAGIYKIENKINGKVYIGQSRDTLDRIRSHRKELRGGYHSNRHLQSAWNKYGEDNFSFEIITMCGFDNLYFFENMWMHEYESYDREFGYNISMPSEDMLSFTPSEESRKIMSEKMKLIMIKYSDDELISYLHEFYYMEGRLPTSRGDLITAKGYPSVGTYEHRFGNMKNALEIADLYHLAKNKIMFDRGIVTREQVIENYSEFVEVNGRFPSSFEQRNTSISKLYPTSTVLRLFNGIQELKDILGLTKEKALLEENEDALKSLKELHEELGNIDSRIIDKSRKTRSTSFYSRRFGSLNKAYEMAGIVFDKCRYSIPIVQLTKDGMFIKEWDSATVEQEEIGITNGNIAHALKGRNPSAGGFKWVYKKDYNGKN